MSDGSHNDGWEQWSNYVLEELKDLNSKTSKIDDSVNNLRIEVAMLKVKSGVWGIIGGSVPVLIFAFVKFLEK